MQARVGAVGDLAVAIRDALHREAPSEALRWVAEFITDVGRAPTGLRGDLLADEPGRTGSPAWDALLAGVTEMLAVADELEARGIAADLFLVGGAAMVLAYDRQRATRDLDAVFEPKTAVYEAARAVAVRRDLPEDWLNDAVKGFLPGEDPAATVFLDRPALRVRVASPRHLFAMKAMAGAGGARCR